MVHACKACHPAEHSCRLRVLLLRRSDNGRWGLPGGSVETGGPVAVAVLHEVREETGPCIGFESPMPWRGPLGPTSAETFS